MSQEREDMRKRVLAGVFLSSFFALTGWLIFVAFKAENFPLGSPLPALHYRTEAGRETLQSHDILKLMLVHFHSECEHCQYELELFDQNLPALSGTRIVLLTFEDDFFEKDKKQTWPSLADAANVTWGVVDKGEFVDRFGIGVTPAIFIFDKTDTLRSKIVGEAKLEKILSELKKIPGGPER